MGFFSRIGLLQCPLRGTAFVPLEIPGAVNGEDGGWET